MTNYNLDVEQAEIGTNGLAIKAGWIKTYIADPITREYLYASMEYTYFDVSVSANAYIDAPELPEIEGIAVIRRYDGIKWEMVNDYRGKNAYQTDNRQIVVIDFIGELPESLTFIVPQTEFDVWNGESWVTDVDAQKVALVVEAEKQKSSLLQEATMQIAYLQNAVDIGLATEEETTNLQKWKTYSVLLSRINISDAANIEWPEKP